MPAEPPATIHLHPTAALAERVLLPGDPGRALTLAQELLDSPRMFNHNRGLWGYTGMAPDGMPLTIQSTGMGGPSTAIVVAELIDLGARTLVRVGTCGALADGLALGELVIADPVRCNDGTSHALSTDGEAIPDPDLTEGLVAATRAEGVTAHRGPVVSTDLFYDSRGPEETWRAEGGLAVEMEAATLLTLATIREVRAAALLLVTDLILPARRRIPAAELRAAEPVLGRVALAGLGFG